MPSTAKRSAAALATALMLCGQLALVLHFLLIPHHLCPQHGVLEHGGEHGTDHAQATNPHSNKGAMIALAVFDSDDEHDACAVPARLERQESAAGGGASTVGPLFARASIDPFEHPVAIEQSRAILLSAPKQSPPINARC